VPGALIREGATLTNDARRDIPSTLIATGFSSADYRSYAADNPPPFLAGLPELRNVTYVDLPTSHWPMWSKPKELAAIIADVARAHATAD
jgi:pimeloyl-ACP methyl ester carboxylesterase